MATQAEIRWIRRLYYRADTLDRRGSMGMFAMGFCAGDRAREKEASNFTAQEVRCRPMTAKERRRKYG